MMKGKSRKKRLFLFAGYDGAGIIDDAELLYVRACAALGDVVYVMDSDASDAELRKVKSIPNVLYVAGKRHGEYDFGSYKRAYIYAHDAGILDNYEFLYMVNDSVYGPIFDLEPVLKKMESYGFDAFGPVMHPDSLGIYIQSWFLGMRRTVFLSEWFDEFMMGIKKLADKGSIIFEYERGFTTRLIERNMTFGGTWTCRGRAVYNRVRHLYRVGMPFIKRNAFNRRHGALGRQLLYVLDRIDPIMRDAILDNVRRTLGTAHLAHLLTRNPLKILYRNIAHSMRKLFIEGI